MLHGDWNVYEGQFFTEFTDNREGYINRQWTHVVEPFPIPPTWKRYRAMDWGYSKPFSVGWYAIDHDGRAYRYREWYGCTGEPDVGLRLTPSQVAEEIAKIEKELEPEGVFIQGVADPAIFATQTGETVAETMGKYGVYFEPGDNKRLSGWDQMRERMRFDPEGYPMFYVFNTCRHFIRTVPALIHDETKAEDLDTKQEDHCLTGDTLVWTDNGKVPIAKLVGTEGKVYSSDCKLHNYYDCRMTQQNVDVYEVELEDGTTIKATSNHRFMLADGTWKRLDELIENDELWSDCID